jgi:hypothetical protein
MNQSGRRSQAPTSESKHNILALAGKANKITLLSYV